MWNFFEFLRGFKWPTSNEYYFPFEFISHKIKKKSVNGMFAIFFEIISWLYNSISVNKVLFREEKKKNEQMFCWQIKTTWFFYINMFGKRFAHCHLTDLSLYENKNGFAATAEVLHGKVFSVKMHYKFVINRSVTWMWITRFA